MWGLGQKDWVPPVTLALPRAWGPQVQVTGAVALTPTPADLSRATEELPLVGHKTGPPGHHGEWTFVGVLEGEQEFAALGPLPPWT